jgi:hypothetical protein
MMLEGLEELEEKVKLEVEMVDDLKIIQTENQEHLR